MKSKIKESIYIIMTICLVYSLWPCMHAAASSTDPEKILAEIQKQYTGLTGLKAEYTRITSTPAMEGVFQSTSKHVATGMLYFKKPAKLILDQDSPRKEKLVTNGRTVWWHIPAENLVHRYADADVYGELKPLLDFLNGLGGLEGVYAVKVTPAGKAPNINHRLDLSRLKQGSGPTDITVWCSPDDYRLVGFRMVALTGETTVFNLIAPQTNPGLDDNAFEFKIPEGAQVVDETEGL